MYVHRFGCGSALPRMALLVLVSSLVPLSCTSKSSLKPDRILLDEHASGNNQAAMHGETLPKPLRVVVESQVVPGILGGEGQRVGVAGVPVTFTIQCPETGAVFVENEATRFSTTTGPGGNASAVVRLGHRSGDVNIVASIETEKGAKSVEFRVLSGVELIGSDLEAPTGGIIECVGLRLQDHSGTPAVGIPVYFRIEGNGQGASVGGAQIVRLLTDSQGKAVTSWRLGKAIQQYFVSAEIQDDRAHVSPEHRFRARAIEFHAMAIHKGKMLLELLGGLAVFIVGMKWMSDGLRRIADRRLKAILQTATKNRLVGTGVGALLTAMIQSSSATTVMTVGFVNAGLMTLTQAIGVIYGANIGTTMTAQIIAFRLEVLAYPAIAVGLILTMLVRRPRLNSLGHATMGFGFLFLGITTMSDILKPLRYSPEFQSWFKLFDCAPVSGEGMRAWPALMCILVGTVMTMIIQSSSATVGLVQALGGQGLVSFYTAVPLVLGDNIGTTITAVLASLGANRNAKRAALAHSLFNILGTLIMYMLFFVPLWNGQPVFLGLVDTITPGEAFAAAPENLPRHIANAHTMFNMVNCLVFLPLVKPLARICQTIIPLTYADREAVLEYLEPRLLQTPALALDQAVKEVAYMVQRSRKSINEGCQFFFDGTRELEQKVLAREDLIDKLQHEITGYLVELSRKSLSPTEAALIPALIHAVNDAERIGDHSTNLLELAHLRRDGKHALSETALADIRKIESLLNEQFDATYRSLVEGDAEQTDRVLQKEQEITVTLKRVSEDHVRRLETGECNVLAGVIFLDFLAHLERVGDHLVNIAERAGAITQVTGG